MSEAHSRSQHHGRQGQQSVPGALFYPLPRALCFLLALWLLLSPLSHPSTAQPAAVLQVLPPDTAAFPTMAVAFDIFSPDPSVGMDLQANQVTLYENNQPLPIETLTQTYQGVHLTLALNANRELDLRDAEGVSRFEKIAAALRNWAPEQILTAEDAWTLITNQGLQVRRTDDTGLWLEALNAFQPNFRAVESDLTSLETAIQTSRETVTPFGVDKVLLYITPPPTAEQIPRLTELAQTARSEAIHINVWMVASELYFANDQGKALEDLAGATGGEFFGFTGVEEIPDPGAYLDSLGTHYTLTYTSRITTTGTYPLALEAALPGVTLQGESQPFYLEVAPPDPIFVSPPAVITRTADSAAPDAAFTPSSLPLEILIQFPDQHPRQITASRLFVDGLVVDENTAPPFTHFLWDLSAFTEPGEHTLQVEVVDSLGLEARTITVPVTVEVVAPEPPPPEVDVARILRIAGIGLLGLILLALLVWGLRRLLTQRRTNNLKRRMLGRAHPESPGAPGQKTLAWLIPLNGPAQDGDPSALRISQKVTLLGRDPRRCALPLDAPTIAPLHSRLTALNGQFWLKDLSSETGTWVNYRQIGTEDVPVKSGDLIHFGLCGFRFKIESPEAQRAISVSDYETIL
jgi:hypothetical protein